MAYRIASEVVARISPPPPGTPPQFVRTGAAAVGGTRRWTAAARCWTATARAAAAMAATPARPTAGMGMWEDRFARRLGRRGGAERRPIRSPRLLIRAERGSGATSNTATATPLSSATAVHDCLILDTMRTIELNIYITFYDSVFGRLLIAAGQPEQARARLVTALALARDTGMCFYDAELLRLRAHTHIDPDARRADIAAALELARRQGATLFELRAALDDFELRGEPARAALNDVANRFPTTSAWPELTRARALLH